MLDSIRVFFLHTVFLYLLCIIAAPFICVAIYERTGWFSKRSLLWIIWNGVVTAILFLALSIIGHSLINNWLRRPSSVDISPLASLSEDSADFVVDALELLVARDIIRFLHLSEFPGGERYSSGWISNPQMRTGSRSDVPRLEIRVEAYRTEAIAISRMNQSRPWAEHRTRRDILNDNRTAAKLYSTWMPVNEYRILGNERRTLSFFRIGNVVFELSEIRDWRDRSPEYSSQFIAIFVEALHLLQNKP